MIDSLLTANSLGVFRKRSKSFRRLLTSARSAARSWAGRIKVALSAGVADGNPVEHGWTHARGAGDRSGGSSAVSPITVAR
jgi:hypothetical protein